MTIETNQEHNRLAGIVESPAQPARLNDGIGGVITDLAVSELPVLNWAGALRRVGGDEQLLGEMAGLFLNTYPDQFARIAEAVENSDAGALEIHAHTLRGTAGVFCAERVAAAAANLDRIAEKKAWPQAIAGLAALRQELSRMRPVLQVKLPNAPAA